MTSCQWAESVAPRARYCRRTYLLWRLHAWEAQDKALGRKSPIPVVLRSNETPDHYEADFTSRIHPHSDVMKHRSQRINLAVKRVKEKMGGSVPPVTPHYTTSASPLRLAKIFQLAPLFIGSNQAFYVSTEGINRFP